MHTSRCVPKWGGWDRSAFIDSVLEECLSLDKKRVRHHAGLVLVVFFVVSHISPSGCE